MWKLNTKLHHLLVAVLTLSNLLYPTTIANTAPNPIEIISISEVSSTSVEILFNSNLSKKSLSYYVINAAIELPVAAPQNSKTQNVVAIAPKNIKKVIKTKATGLITAKVKNLNPKAAYNFSVSVKTNKGKMISSAAVEYSPLSNLMDLLSNLPADWGNPKPTTTVLAAPAFTLSPSSESKVVNTAISGYTISSSGGAISSYSISPAAPTGLTFNTTTGLLTGTPTVVAVETTYTITATNASGSTAKTFTLTVAPTAPAFTLSSSTETRMKNTAATGFTINSTGGAISRFTINATPPGMSFNTTTGALTGTPNTIAAATNYTITATNASGSATQTFRLTVTAVVYTVGQAGPGGGKVYYYNATGFNCGATHSATGSPTGGLCNYLEVAPKGWYSGVATDPRSGWVNLVDNRRDVEGVINEHPANNSFTGLGLGYKNSLAIIAAVPGEPSAASLTRTYSNNSLSDWYLPSAAELNELYKWANGNVTQPALGTPAIDGDLNSLVNGFTSNFDFVNHYYWSSSETTLFFAWHQWMVNGAQLFDMHFKSAEHFVRPVRAF